ncbi:MAG: zinc-dependent alcohol dehydrogenase family protein [Ignavibacteria bacterium]|nr:zinc-dependent alcohol dehydrogenase family protein [Ignavibacteria bacterium]
MKAMVLQKPCSGLQLTELPVPEISDSQVLIKVHACGVCRTDLHVVDGELPDPHLPLIPGHEIIGEVVKTGKNVENLNKGDIVGVPWLGYTCSVCRYCSSGRENLCESAKFTGYTLNGGYAEYTVADYRYCFSIPDNYDFYHTAPLMCAGLIAYRSYRMCGENVKNLGIYGFGAAAHIITQVAVWQKKNVFAFTRKGDSASQEFALSMGCVWAGNSGELPPEKLDAAIIFAPVGELVPLALRAIDKGGVVVCGGIHMSNIPEFEYRILWEERQIRSVANLTREDGMEFFRLISQLNLKTEIKIYSLDDANQALDDLRKGRINGAAVLKII